LTWCGGMPALEQPGELVRADRLDRVDQQQGAVLEPRFLGRPEDGVLTQG
jgi:hypothetical protein